MIYKTKQEPEKIALEARARGSGNAAGAQAGADEVVVGAVCRGGRLAAHARAHALCREPDGVAGLRAHAEAVSHADAAAFFITDDGGADRYADAGHADTMADYYGAAGGRTEADPAGYSTGRSTAETLRSRRNRRIFDR